MSAENKTLTPVWIAYVDGKRLNTDYEGALESVKVNDRVNGVGKASLLFDASTLKIDEDGVFSLMSEVSIHLGYKDDVEEVFRGVVTAFAPQFNQYSNPKVEVRISSLLYPLKIGNRSRSFEKKTPSDIISEILSEYSLNSDVESFGPEYEYMEQQEVSDFDFIMQLASLYGKDVYCCDKKVSVRSEIKNTGDDVVLEWGKSLISCSVSEKLEGQFSEVTCIGYDKQKAEFYTATAKMNDVTLKVGGSNSFEKNSKGTDPNKSHFIVGARDSSDAKDISTGFLQKRSMEFQRAEATAEGDYAIKPGNRISLKYIGSYFSGEWLVEGVNHEFSIYDGYKTNVNLKRNFCEKGNNSSSVSAIDQERTAGATSARNDEFSQGNSGNSQTDENQNEEAAAAGTSEEEKSIRNPHWEDASGNVITKALVGDEVYLCAEVSGIPEMKSVKLKIVEKDSDGNDDDITTLPSSVKDSKIRRQWKVIYTPDEDDENSRKEMEEKGYTLPEYAFTVECDGLTSEESGQLDVMGWIKTQFKNKRTGKVIANRDYVIYLLDGSTITGKTTSDGYVKVLNLKQGEYFISFKDSKIND